MIYAAATSLDGFVADGHGNLDWLFGHPIDPDGPGGFGEIDARAGALLMGRTTSDWVAAELARTGDRWPQRQPCWVLTSRPLDDGIPGAVAAREPHDGGRTRAARDLRGAPGGPGGPGCVSYPGWMIGMCST